MIIDRDFGRHSGKRGPLPGRLSTSRQFVQTTRLKDAGQLYHDCLVHSHVVRNHQGKGKLLPFPTAMQAKGHAGGSVRCKDRLSGLLKHCHREAA